MLLRANNPSPSEPSADVRVVPSPDEQVPARAAGLRAGTGHLPCWVQTVCPQRPRGVLRRKNEAPPSCLPRNVSQQECARLTILEAEGGEGQSVLHCEAEAAEGVGCEVRDAWVRTQALDFLSCATLRNVFAPSGRTSSPVRWGHR